MATTTSSSTPIATTSGPSDLNSEPARVERQHVAGCDIAVAVGSPDIVERVPAADVRPSHLHRHHRDPVRLLHHRMVDRLGAHPSEGGRLRQQASALPLAPRRSPPPRRPGCRPHARRAPRAVGRPETGRCRRSSHSLPRPDSVRRSRGRASRRTASASKTPAAIVAAAPDIAVAGLGRFRPDAEGDQPALPGQGRGGPHRGEEGRRLGDDMVARHDQKQRVRPASSAASAIAAAVLRPSGSMISRAGRDAALAELAFHLIGVAGAGDHDRRLEQVGVGRARRSRLEQGFAAGQRGGAAWAGPAATAATAACRRRPRG